MVRVLTLLPGLLTISSCGQAAAERLHFELQPTAIEIIQLNR